MGAIRTDGDHMDIRVLWLPGNVAVMLPIEEADAEAALTEMYYSLLVKIGLHFAIPDLHEHCQWLAENTIVAMAFTDEEVDF